MNTYCFETIIGVITIKENGNAITHLTFGKPSENAHIVKTPLINKAYLQLKEYFEGKRKNFDLPLAPKGTLFQEQVWNALRDIPYGSTCTYKDIAITIGNDKACRAVGMANNRNPISILIPCHRVIGSNGKLIGYGGGLDIKEQLLTLETQHMDKTI